MARNTSADRVTEHEVADAVCRALVTEAGREASIKKLVQEVPNFLKLSPADLAQSPTRKNEALWEQQIRNIQSHHASPGNFIHEGFLESTKGGLRLTDGGVRRLEEKGLI